MLLLPVAESLAATQNPETSNGGSHANSETSGERNSDVDSAKNLPLPRPPSITNAPTGSSTGDLNDVLNAINDQGPISNFIQNVSSETQMS